MASGAEESANMNQQLKLLKYSRRGKKGSITKRIAQLEKLMEEGGKKKMIRFLVDALDKVYLELEVTDFILLFDFFLFYFYFSLPNQNFLRNS